MTYLETEPVGDLGAAWSIFAEFLLREKISCVFGANSIAFVSGIIRLLFTKLPTMKKRNLAVCFSAAENEYNSEICAAR